jgi:CubicO group peptidase (beta-lactamase class C family)
MKMHRSFSFLLLLCFTVSLNAQKLPAFVTDSLDTYINREMAAWNLPGLAIAIVKDGKVVTSKGYGVREVGKPGKVNDKTLFQIASCSKAFTGTALALLDAEKKLSLDDTVRRWVPGFHLNDPLANKAVTLRDLLCHRIGLQTFQADFVHWDSDLSRDQIIGLMAKHEPQIPFRSAFGYCNAAFLAAGQAIPAATGKTWDEFLAERFFSPLGMSRTTTMHKFIAADTNACSPYTRWEGQQYKLDYDNIDNLGPAGSLNSCVSDLGRWLLMNLDSGRFNGKEIVPYSALKKTYTPHTIIPRTSSIFPSMHFQAYGLGWFLADIHGRKVIWHDGGAAGFLSTVCFLPEENVGFVILTNSDNNSLFTALRYQLIDAFCGKPYRNYSQVFLPGELEGQKENDAKIAKWREEVKLAGKPPVMLAAFMGSYGHPVYGRMYIDGDKAAGKLTARFQHHPQLKATLEYMGNGKMLCSFNSPLWGIAPAELELNADGTVKSLTIHLPGFLDNMPYEFVKVRAGK